MRNKFLLFALVFVLAAGTSWAQFWKNYSEKDRESMAQAYWLAGRQYQKAGKTEKGSEFMRMARVIDPMLDPASIKEETLPSAAELLARGGSSAIGANAGQVPVQSLDSFFLRFLGALLAKDPDAASGFLDGSVYLSQTQSAVTRAEEKSALARFFTEAPLDGKTPSDLYNLDSVVVAGASPDARAAWGDAYTLDVDANADYSQYGGFGEQKQRFFVHSVDGEWRIFAVGRSQPPLSWKPERAPAVEAAEPSAEKSQAEASKAILDAFTTCLGDLLKKDTDGAAAYMADNVSLLRLRQSVTRAELKTTLDGSLENADLGAPQVADAVDVDSAFVERAQSPVEGVAGEVYSLSIRAKEDLTKALPFWSSYQRYYFMLDNGQWKIFALF
ncbi:MAG TPA: hypothetical protein VMM82_12540 [Spirochaetia bacterium]|nr:hypothetical protein [Spirochaetia bacterium]